MPKATIVIPKSPTDKVRLAAEDLQAYLSEIVGGIIKIGYDNVDRTNGNFILVGQTAQTKSLGIKQSTGYPGTERVIIKRVNNYLVLLGNDDGNYRGTEFAVNMFLEKLGCGWFGPDELWQVVPSIKTLAIDKLNVDHKPQFSSRITNVYYGYQKFSRRWYQGGDMKTFGHYLPKLVSRDVYFQSHPEWYALVNGKRDPYAATWWQFCYTNKDLAAEVAKKIIAEFDRDPNLTQFSLAANDGWEEDWCECSVCTGIGNDSDATMYFANNVAKITGKKYPNKKITILSYHSTFFAPQKIKAEPNVEVMFCRETSMTVPLDLNLAIPSGYNAITHNTYTQSWLGNFKEYIQKANLKSISIWDWNCIAADKAVWADIPWVQGNVATRNQKLWKSNGVEYVYVDQGPHSAYRETEDSFTLRWPLWYVASKGMWDSSMTGEQILQDACNRLFGNASNEMFKYYKALADSSEQCRATSSITWVPPAPSEVYTPQRVNVIDNAITAVKRKLSSVTEDQKKRIQNQIQSWEQSKLLIQYN
ncbi:MAG: DUF4838 domain-containing protein [Oscillospiraceae bacterium]|nr:DUF4838 domain-containing protein [Oscillospiraceae bacterium]